MSSVLLNLWYLAIPGPYLPPGRMRAKTIAGEPILVGRDREGRPFAVRDICPHRGVPLSFGRFDGVELQCAYHGWRFNCEGRCTSIPSLTDDQDFDVARIKVRSYPCREHQGNVWIFIGDKPRAGAAVGGESDLPDIPDIPDLGDRRPQVIETQVFTCGVDQAAVGLVDPAHGPFVHESWFWRSRRSIHEKSKRFVPSPLGFKMARHRPSSNSAVYRLLGGETSTEIRFQLPGVRIENIQAGKHLLCGLTVVTPIDEGRTEVSHMIYFTQPWLTPFKPLLKRFAKTFLGQDKRMMNKLQIGLAQNPTPILVNDADTQIKWYYRLKKEWVRHLEDGDAFRNPVKETVLRWRT